MRRLLAVFRPAAMWRAFAVGCVVSCAGDAPDYSRDFQRALRAPSHSTVGQAGTQAGRLVITPAHPAPRPFLRIKNRNPAGYLKRESIPYIFTLGEIAFRSPLLFGGKARELGLSCRSCHPNGHANTRFFIPGNSSRPGTVDVTHAFFGRGRDNGIADPVRIPSLRGVRFRAPYGHDGRSNSLREFTRHVIRGEFAGGEPSALILDALETYLREFEFLPAPGLDPRGRPRAKGSARRGYRVFLKKCADCHPPSRYFRDGRVHRLGTKKRVSPWAVEGGVKTPTLLGMRARGLFHDASLPDLFAAIRWFRKRDNSHWAPEDPAALGDYLKLVARVEKPLDERGPGERLLELTAALRFFESALDKEERFSSGTYDFFLASLIIDYIREMKTLRRPRAQSAARNFLRQLRAFQRDVRGGITVPRARRALELERKARAEFSRLIME